MMIDWILVDDRKPPEKKYTRCLLAVHYLLAEAYAVTLEQGAYDGWSKSFEWGRGQYAEDEHYKVLGWYPEYEVELPPPPEPPESREE